MAIPNPLFDSIRKAVCAWVNDIEKKYSAELNIERIKDKPDIYLAYIFLKNCAAQVIVTDPEWAPYRYVGFEAYSGLGEEEAQLVFSWYDSDEDDVESIIQQLQAGIEYVISYDIRWEAHP